MDVATLAPYLYVYHFAPYLDCAAAWCVLWTDEQTGRVVCDPDGRPLYYASTGEAEEALRAYTTREARPYIMIEGELTPLRPRAIAIAQEGEA